MNIPTGVHLGYRGIGVLGDLPGRDLQAALRIVGEAGASGFEVMQDVVFNNETANKVHNTAKTWGLQCSALDVFYEEVKDGDRWVRSIEQAKILGARRVIVMASTSDWELSQYGELNLWLCKASELAAQADLRIEYHPHDSEYRRLDADGTGLDHILSGSGCHLVIDTYWAYKGGQRAADLLVQYKGQCQYMHVKTDGLALQIQDLLVQPAIAGLDWLIVEENRPGDGDIAQTLRTKIRELAGVKMDTTRVFHDQVGE